MILSGKNRVAESDSIRVRVLYKGNEMIKIDRPFRQQPLKINLPDTTLDSVFDHEGTYELVGTVRKMIYAELQGPDYLFLESDFQVNCISNSFLQIESSNGPDDSQSIGYTQTNVDFDVESLSDVVIEEKSR